jgi:hypothetical protein
MVALTTAPTAAASGWAIQPTPKPAGARSTALIGVSCSVATRCTAVGDFVSRVGATLTLAEGWDGTSWTTQRTPDPSGALYSVLAGVSCSSATACTAVGYYDSRSAKAVLPLAESWDGSSWSIQPTEVPSGSTASYLAGVSCTSPSACTAVGQFSTTRGAQALVEFWDGTSWTVEPTPPGGGLSGVSCTSVTSCVAVGASDAGQLAETWNGSSWTISLTGTFNGATSSELDAVSCTTASRCTAVGHTVKSGTTLTLGLVWNGSTWSLQSTQSPGRTVSRLSGVACIADGTCWAVGTFDNFRGTSVTLGEFWNGFSWSFATVPEPNGGFTPSFLNAVSCSSSGACTAVGDVPSGAAEAALAEQFTPAAGRVASV